MTKLPYQPIILVADDEPSTRTNLRLLLEAEGYSVREAADGGQAARVLGISRRQLFDKIRQYGLHE